MDAVLILGSIAIAIGVSLWVLLGVSRQAREKRTGGSAPKRLSWGAAVLFVGIEVLGLLLGILFHASSLALAALSLPVLALGSVVALRGSRTGN
ncbi:MAG: hypothetical protein QOF58_689 [Pseudonocardiales bacterium]|jgi:hypothetical protein|nr:hypothetical protein [Pseudonocardiales bacterium]